jgi:hypothetical protein
MIRRQFQQRGSAHTVEILPFIWVIVVVIREFYLQPVFHSLSEPFVKTSHVHFVPLYVREVPFVEEELADVAELSVGVPEFGSALYPILPLCIN